MDVFSSFLTVVKDAAVGVEADSSFLQRALVCTHSQNCEEQSDEEEKRSVSHAASSGHEEELLL